MRVRLAPERIAGKASALPTAFNVHRVAPIPARILLMNVLAAQNIVVVAALWCWFSP
jgi:hypothetical protein